MMRSSHDIWLDAVALSEANPIFPIPPSVEAPHVAVQAKSTKVSCPSSRPRGFRGRWQTARDRLPSILADAVVVGVIMLILAGALHIVDRVAEGVTAMWAGLLR